MEETGNESADMKNKLLAKQLQIDKTSASLEKQTAKLNEMSSALEEAGINTDDLAHSSEQLAGEIDALKKKEEAAAEKANTFGVRAETAFNAVHEAIVAAGVAAALKEIYEYFSDCSQASMDFESAITGVAKTTDLTDSELATKLSDIMQHLLLCLYGTGAVCFPSEKLKILIWIIAILHFQYRGQPVELGYFAFREFIGQCCLKQLIFAFNHFEIRIAQFLYLAEMTKLRCSNSQSLHGSTFVECPWYFFIHLPKQFQQPLIYTAVIVLNRKNIMVVYLITQDGFEEPVLGQAWAVAKLLQFLLKFRAKFEVGVFRHP